MQISAYVHLRMCAVLNQQVALEEIAADSRRWARMHKRHKAKKSARVFVHPQVTSGAYPSK
jgi:hypothetical protein